MAAKRGNVYGPVCSRYADELYLDEEFRPEYAEWAAQVRSEEYYVNMMVAWYFATALAKRYEEILPYFTERRLALWTHNKAIQKRLRAGGFPLNRRRSCGR